jgi:hypothetical protein
MAEAFDVIAAADLERDWARDGATGLAPWLVGHARHSTATAKAWAAAATALPELPALRGAFGEGVLSWDQLSPAISFATPVTDVELAEELAGKTVAQIEAMARGHKVRTRDHANEARRQRGFHSRIDRETGGSFFRGFLPADESAIVEARLTQRGDKAGPNAETGRWDPEHVRWADALVDLCREDHSVDPGPDPTVVVIHVPAEVVDGIRAGNGTLHGVEIPRDSVLRALCDCAIEFSVDGPDGTTIGIGRARRDPPRWLRRRILHRDVTCRFPGCGRRIRHIHHIRQWIRDHGPTDAWNLCGLCFHHHHLVHEGGWSISGNADNHLTFISPQGVRHTGRGSPVQPDVVQRVAEATGWPMPSPSTQRPWDAPLAPLTDADRAELAALAAQAIRAQRARQAGSPSGAGPP